MNIHHSVSYRADIDGLRAVAVLLVIVFHAFPDTLPSGFIGVDIFFVISGYLISFIILNQTQAGTFRLSDFYARRIRRIFPAFLVVTSATLAFGWLVLFPNEYIDLGAYALASAAFVANIVFYLRVDYFAPDMATQPLIHTWSLSVEEQFYLIWPLLLAWTTQHRRLQLWLMVGVWVSSLMLNLWLVNSDLNAAFYWPVSRFWELASGGSIAWVMRERPAWYMNLSLRVRNVVAGIGWLGIMAGVVWITKESAFPGYWAMLPVIGSVLIIGAGDEAWLNSRILAHPWLVSIGLISYPLYLWHWPLLVYTGMTIPTDQLLIANGMAVVLSMVLAYVTYRVLETPIRRRVTNRGVLIGLLLGMLGIAGLGWYIQQGHVVVRLDEIAQRQDVLPPLSHAKTLSVREGCEGWDIPIQRLTACWQHTGPDTREYVVIGDSHATATMSGFVEILPQHPIIMVSRHGCPPLIGVDRVGNAYDTGRIPCGLATQEMLEFVKRLPERSERTVVVFGRYSLIYNTATQDWMYTPDAPAGYFDVINNLEGPVRTPYVEVLTTGYEAFLAELVQLPADRIIVVLQVPELDKNPINCLRGLNTAQSCRIPRDVALSHMEQSWRIIREVAQRYPKIEVYDPTATFCDEAYCYGAVDGTLWYRDDHHLNRDGSRRLVESLLRNDP